MSNRKRKHGIFAVSGDEVALSINKEEAQEKCMPIIVALNTIFNQMRIGGNRPHTIESYEYIIK